MKTLWLWVALATMASCGTATASTRWHRGDSAEAVRARQAMRAAAEQGLPDWQGLALMGAGLCASSGFCVYLASRAKRISRFAEVIPISGAMSRG